MPDGDSQMSMRMRFVILIGGTILLLVGWFALAFRPASSKLAEVKDQVATVRAEIAALETRLATLQALKANEKELKAQAAKFKKALPAEPAVSTYIRQMQRIAEEAGIDWISVTPTVPSEPPAPAVAAPPPTDGTAPAPSPATSPPPGTATAAGSTPPVPAVT